MCVRIWSVVELVEKVFSKNSDVTLEVKIRIVDLVLKLVDEPNEVFSLPLPTFLPVLNGLRKIVENNEPLKQSLLCIAFNEKASEDLILHLVKEGYDEKHCETHCSIWGCAKQIENEGVKNSVVRILMETNMDVIRNKPSFICNIIREYSNVQQIEMLVSVGAQLENCNNHNSVLLCATENLHMFPLKADMVKFILDRHLHSGQVNDDGFTPLQLALEHCFKYEVEAISLLLEEPGVDVNDVANPKGANLLHFAVGNPYCKKSIVERLIKMGARVDMANNNGDTPLHVAVKKQASNPSIVLFLLDNGSPINAVNKNNKTALELAVTRGRGYNMLKELIMRGAHMGVSDDKSKHALLKLALRLYDNEPIPSTAYELFEITKTLVKFQFLLKKNFDIEPVLKGRADFSLLFNYAESCTDELEKMESELVGKRLNLRKFLRLHSLTKKSKNKTIQLDQLIKLRPDVKFPIYFDVIASKLFRELPQSQLDSKLHNLIYVRKDSPQDPSKQVKISLFHRCAETVANLLTDEELLNMIIAFTKPGDHAGKGSTLKHKRKGDLEQSPHSSKRQK